MPYLHNVATGHHKVEAIRDSVGTSEATKTISFSAAWVRVENEHGTQDLFFTVDNTAADSTGSTVNQVKVPASSAVEIPANVGERRIRVAASGASTPYQIIVVGG